MVGVQVLGMHCYGMCQQHREHTLLWSRFHHITIGSNGKRMAVQLLRMGDIHTLNKSTHT